MARLVNKFNVLIKSSVNSVLKDVTTRGTDTPKPPKLGKDTDKELARLRKQIDAALDHEDRITADIAEITRQIAEWDRQADAALESGDDNTARQLVRQIQRAQQQRAMLEADLDQHRRSTSELIRQVNAFEAVVAEARQQSEDQPQQNPAEERDADTESLSERLRKARDIATGDRNAASPTPADATVTNDDQLTEQAIEDDLARRRNRLSL